MNVQIRILQQDVAQSLLSERLHHPSLITVHLYFKLQKFGIELQRSRFIAEYERVCCRNNIERVT